MDVDADASGGGLEIMYALIPHLNSAARTTH